VTRCCKRAFRGQKPCCCPRASCHDRKRRFGSGRQIVFALISLFSDRLSSLSTIRPSRGPDGRYRHFLAAFISYTHEARFCRHREQGPARASSWKRVTCSYENGLHFFKGLGGGNGRHNSYPQHKEEWFAKVVIETRGVRYATARSWRDSIMTHRARTEDDKGRTKNHRVRGRLAGKTSPEGLQSGRLMIPYISRAGRHSDVLAQPRTCKLLVWMRFLGPGRFQRLGLTAYAIRGFTPAPNGSS